MRPACSGIVWRRPLAKGDSEHPVPVPISLKYSSRCCDEVGFVLRMYLDNSLLRAFFGCAQHMSTVAIRRAHPYFVSLTLQFGRRPEAALMVIFATGTLAISAQVQGNVEFASLIRTPAGVQRTLEYCDGHPEFETAL